MSVDRRDPEVPSPPRIVLIQGTRAVHGASIFFAFLPDPPVGPVDVIDSSKQTPIIFLLGRIATIQQVKKRATVTVSRSEHVSKGID